MFMCICQYALCPVCVHIQGGKTASRSPVARLRQFEPPNVAAGN